MGGSCGTLQPVFFFAAVQAAIEAMFGMAPKTNVNLAMGLPRLLGREGERTITAPPPGLEAFGPLADTAADRSEKANGIPDVVLDGAPRFAQEEGRLATTCVAEMNEFAYAPFTGSDLPFGHAWSDGSSTSTAVPIDTVPTTLRWTVPLLC